MKSACSTWRFAWSYASTVATRKIGWLALIVRPKSWKLPVEMIGGEVRVLE